MIIVTTPIVGLYNKKKKSSLYNNPLTQNISTFFQNRPACFISHCYVSEMEPEYSAVAKRALMLPAQKHEQLTMDFLTRSEFDSMIAVRDTNIFIGARDKLMLMVLYNSGVRVSELLAIKLADLQRLDKARHASLRIYGKGRKQREIPLWKSTVMYMNKYMKDYPIGKDGNLFKNKNGDKLTRSGVRTPLLGETSD